MEAAFELAAGTVTGGDHAALGRANQDALAVWRGADATIAVVADGCGSSRGSEIGARLGARLLAQALRRRRRQLETQPAAAVLEIVRRELLGHLRRLAAAVGDDAGAAATVEELFLFTLVGAVITGSRALVFAAGDGVIAVNGAVRVLSFPGNAPPYLGYGLLREGPAFTVLAERPTAELESLLVATDGLAALLPAQPLAPLWAEDRYFRNPAALTRELTLLNRSRTRIDWERRQVHRSPGLLPDDTTVIALRRRPRPS
ncbi:MAG TPA: protein phosphatase 2C domain-containing protein [Vicinamibacteria bacterium]